MTWAAIGTAAAGAVVSAGVSYAAAQASKPGPATIGTQPPFNPVDIPSANKQAAALDIKGYDLADQDLAARFPGLVAGRNAQIQDASKQLTGPLDPTVQNAFTKQGAIQALGSTGGGNIGANLGTAGSAAQNTTAATVANDTLDKQNYDRSTLGGLLAANPQQSIGFTGPDDTQLAIGNLQNQNQYNQAKYAYQIQQQNANNTGGGF